MNKVILDQLNQVKEADLSRYDEATKTYIIPKKVGIKLEEEGSYLIYFKPAFFQDVNLKVNWNNNSTPVYSYMIVEVSKIMTRMIKVVGVGYDIMNKTVTDSFWTGWVDTSEIEVLERR